MVRLSRCLVVSALIAFSVITPLHSAQAATRCVSISPSTSRCFTATNLVKGVEVVESVPLVNKSRKTVNAQCSFSRTITRSVSAGVDMSATLKGTLFKVVDASTTLTVHTSVSQTAAQATTAGGSVRLKPGQKLICQRIYSRVVANIKEVTYYPAPKNSTTRNYQAKTPSSLGVRFVD